MNKQYVFKVFIVCCYFYFISACMHAQDNLHQVRGAETPIQPVKIGEYTSDILFNKILNHDQFAFAKIADFKGKLLILDFWNVNCAVCIKGFPKLSRLQEKFGSEILILSVGYERIKGEIVDFILKRKGTAAEIKIPTAVISEYKEKQILNAMFPHTGVPFIVWIDKDGRFLGSGSHMSLSEDNIRNLLNGSLKTLTVMKYRHGVDAGKSFLVNKNNTTFASAFCGFLDTLRINSVRDIKQDTSLFHYIGVNLTVFDYYKTAYSKHLPSLEKDGWRKRIIVETTNKNFYQDFSQLKD